MSNPEHRGSGRNDTAKPRVLEEDWNVVTDADGHVDVALYVDGEYNSTIFQNNDVGDRARSRASLAAAAPEMARMLLSLEFPCHNEHGEDTCAHCDATQVEASPHSKDCPWLSLMQKAGVLE